MSKFRCRQRSCTRGSIKLLDFDLKSILWSTGIPSLTYNQISGAAAPLYRVSTTFEVIVAEWATITPAWVEKAIIRASSLRSITVDEFREVRKVLTRCSKHCADRRDSKCDGRQEKHDESKSRLTRWMIVLPLIPEGSHPFILFQSIKSEHCPSIFAPVCWSRLLMDHEVVRIDRGWFKHLALAGSKLFGPIHWRIKKGLSYRSNIGKSVASGVNYRYFNPQHSVDRLCRLGIRLNAWGASSPRVSSMAGTGLRMKV